MARRHELANQEWNRITHLLPPERTDKRGRPGKENRTMLNAMLWINRSGSQWRNLPDYYGPWESVYARFRNWRERGIWTDIFVTLSADADKENISIDATSVKVHQSANGGKKGANPRR